MLRPLQTRVFPSIGSQQASALPMQSTVLPAQTTDTGINMNEIMSLMITMMIVVMMMKMMTGAMQGISTA